MIRMAVVTLVGLLLANAAVAQAPATTPAAPMHPSTMSTMKPPAASHSTTATSTRFPDVATAQAHCPTDTVVWLNTASKVYHLPGTRYYGKTRKGVYSCQKDADQAGFRVVRGELAKPPATPATSKP